MFGKLLNFYGNIWNFMIRMNGTDFRDFFLFHNNEIKASTSANFCAVIHAPKIQLFLFDNCKSTVPYQRKWQNRGSDADNSRFLPCRDGT